MYNYIVIPRAGDGVYIGNPTMVTAASAADAAERFITHFTSRHPKGMVLLDVTLKGHDTFRVKEVTKLEIERA